LSQALRDFDAKKSKEVSAAYTAAKNAAGKDAELPMQGLSQDFAEVLDNFGDNPGGHSKCSTYGHPNCSTLAMVI
jgi:hypothetical protein